MEQEESKSNIKNKIMEDYKMGWTEGTFVFKSGMTKAEMEMEIREQLDEERGRFAPVHQKLVLLDISPYESKEEAEEHLRRVSEKYWRKNNVGVPYMQLPDIEKEESIQRIKWKIAEEKQKFVKYAEKHSPTSFKAEFIGCANCKSKIARDFLSGAHCPVCGQDMRSKTTVEKLSAYMAKIRGLEKELVQEKRRVKMKNIKKAEVFWLVKAQAYLG